MRLPKRILFVGAHCDDIELIAGGSLAHACFSGAQVGVMVFSDHRGVVAPVAAERARAEFCSNMSWLASESGATVVDHSTDMLAACRGEFEARREAIYAALEALRDDYDLVVSHAGTDTNQDHQQVAAEVARVFKAHGSVLGGEFPNNDLGAFSAQVFVPLDARSLAAKVKMVNAYESQKFGGRPYLAAGAVESLARVRGSQIRENAAEAFCVAGRLVVRERC